MNLRSLLLLTLWLGVYSAARAQNIAIRLGPDKIGLNEPYTITIEVQNERIREHDPFPDIRGFRKLGTSSSTSTSMVNGQYSLTQSITQNYMPEREGRFTLPAFSMLVNGQELRSPGAGITVGPPVQQQTQIDPFEEMLGRRQPQEFIDVKEDAFFALTVDKKEVYVGEGINATLGFYVAETNRAELSFYETGKQLAEIRKKLTPGNCWEESFTIERLEREDVTLNGRRYGLYRIMESVFYPFNAVEIQFPSVPLQMIKYKVAKNPTFFGRNRQEEVATFYSKPQRVRVKALPPHPLRETVPVGRYELREELPLSTAVTGQSLSYRFSIVGEGNLTAIDKPLVAATDILEFYPPNVYQNINRGNHRVTGSKSFNYFIIPKEPGQHRLGDFIRLVYFDPVRARYDTLQSNTVLQVTGESKKNASISSIDLGTFYDLIESENNRLRPLAAGDPLKLFANMAIFAMLALSIALLVKRK